MSRGATQKAAPAVEKLPPFTSEVARLGAWLGPEATLALVEAYGGTRLYVPEKVNEASALVQRIGIPACTILVERWARDTLKVPVARTWRILVLDARNMSYPEIAHALKCSENTVWRTLNRRGLTDGQLSLFD